MATNALWEGNRFGRRIKYVALNIIFAMPQLYLIPRVVSLWIRFPCSLCAHHFPAILLPFVYASRNSSTWRGRTAALCAQCHLPAWFTWDRQEGPTTVPSDCTTARGGCQGTGDETACQFGERDSRDDAPRGHCKRSIWRRIRRSLRWDQRARSESMECSCDELGA